MFPAIIASALIGGLGSIFSGVMASSAQDKATAAQTKSTDKQLALTEKIFNEGQADRKPWVDAGKTALESLTTKTMSGDFDLSKYGMEHLIQDPGYQFRLEQGQRALDRNATAHGNMFSGDQLKAVSDYNQQAASQEFGNAFARTSGERDRTVGRLTDLSSMGLQAANAQSAGGANYAANTSNILQNQASAVGAGAINTGNIWGNVASGVARSANTGIENWMLYDRLAA